MTYHVCNPRLNLCSEPIVLKEHAKHFETGESVPDELLERLKAAQLFNEGFATVGKMCPTERIVEYLLTCLNILETTNSRFSCRIHSMCPV